MPPPLTIIMETSTRTGEETRGIEAKPPAGSIPVLKTPKPLVIYSILKWYAIALMTFATAYIFVDAVTFDSESLWLVLIYLPVPVYLWSLVVRKLT